MDQINQIIKNILPKTDMISQCDDLPELTEAETESVIQSEMVIRAFKKGVKAESIVLSPETRDRVILFARKRKLSYQKTKEYWDKVYKETPPSLLTADEMKIAFLKKASMIAGKEFIIDKYNDAILQKLFLYFSASSEAEKYGIDLRKGVMLMGGLGTGKSTIMRTFSTNQHRSFRFVSCRYISYDFMESGFSVIKNHSLVETIARNQYWQTERGIHYDDLGTEEERKRYGDNKVNAMGEIIMNRYDQVAFNMTHITTNLNAQDIEQYYGVRIRSRMREMFNIFSFDKSAPDRRK